MRVLLFCVLAAACSSEPGVPAMPSYAAHVRPILLAHCVRCHGAGGMLNGEVVDGMVVNIASGGYFDHYEDQGDCSIPDSGPISPTCKRGAHTYAIPPLDEIVRIYLHPKSDIDFRMPPPPAVPLDATELATVDRWMTNPIP